MNLQVKYITDEKGNKLEVILGYKTFVELMERLKEIEELEEQFLGRIAQERYDTLDRTQLISQEEMEAKVGLR